MNLWWCPMFQRYTRRPCAPMLSTHQDVPVGDVLTEADLDWCDLDGELWLERLRSLTPS